MAHAPTHMDPSIVFNIIFFGEAKIIMVGYGNFYFVRHRDLTVYDWIAFIFAYYK